MENWLIVKKRQKEHVKIFPRLSWRTSRPIDWEVLVFFTWDRRSCFRGSTEVLRITKFQKTFLVTFC